MTDLERMTATAVNTWKQTINRIDQALSSISDAELEQQVANGRNRVFYLVGHLTAVHDRLFLLLGLGARSHPALDAEFLDNPDTHRPSSLAAADLRNAWTEVNTKLTAAFESLRPEEWLEKHTAVSAEDFAKEPLRNRLSVLLSRTNHASFHWGQIRLTR